jgi:hypothetical protein
MAQKLYDLVVKVGEYQNAQGETKARYENVGSVMQGDNGQFAIMKRTFNPAGVPNPDGKDSIIVSMFEPQNSQQQNQNTQQQGGFSNQQQNQGFNNQQNQGFQQQGGFAPQQGQNYQG